MLKKLTIFLTFSLFGCASPPKLIHEVLGLNWVLMEREGEQLMCINQDDTRKLLRELVECKNNKR